MVPVIIAAIGIAIILYIWDAYEWKDMPPGPTGLPFIGYMHMLGSRHLYIVLGELAEKYGRIFSLKIGSRRTIVLNDRNLIHQAFVQKANHFAGRPNFLSFYMTTSGISGIALASAHDEQYKKNKSMNTRAMQHLFSNKENLNLLILKEVDKMSNMFDSVSLNQAPCHPPDYFDNIIPSLVLSIMFGDNYDYTDPEFLSIVGVYKTWFENSESDNPGDFLTFKIFQMLPNKRMNIIAKCGNLENQFSIKKINSHNESEFKKPCLLSSYFTKFERDEESKNVDYNMNEKDDNEKMHKSKISLTPQQLNELARTISDMLSGGFDTLSSFMSWAILFLKKYPIIKKKCREEIMSMVGNRPLSLEDERSLPYFIATLHELLRYTSVGPLGLPRATVMDTTLAGYKIPKDTMVFANIWAANHSPLDWRHPDEIYPEHFLDKDGNLDDSSIKKTLTFSSGVRRCPGQKLAFYICFHIVGKLVQSYDWELVEPPQDMIPKRGLTLKPKFYTCKFSKI